MGLAAKALKAILNMPASCCLVHFGGESCVPVRLKIRLWAFLIWLVFTLPNVIVTLTLYFTGDEGGDGDDGDPTSSEKAPTAASSVNDSSRIEEEVFRCYDNYTVYLPIYEATRFWVEGVGLACVGLLGLCGNGLTLAVLARSKGTKFNRLLVYLSITDCALILFFLLLSYFTVLSSSEPQW